MANFELQMGPQLAQIHGEIRDNFRAISNGFQKLDKIKDSSRQSKQLEDLTGKMRECKRLIKEFDHEIKDEEPRNPPEVNKQLNDEKQSMIKELNSYAALRKTMPETESKTVIGLSWEPKLPSLSYGTTKPRISDNPQNLPKTSAAYRPNHELIDGLFVPPNNPMKLNKLLRKQVKDTSGKNWFDMPAPTITPELKKDLQLLKLRSAIDPKRHYKKGDSKSLPKYFQIGTVIESAPEFYTGRLSKKERKATLADELLSDPSLGDYRKRKVREIEEQHRPGGVEKWKIRGQQSCRRAKQRRH